MFSAFVYFVGQRLIDFDPTGALLTVDAQHLSSIKVNDNVWNLDDNKKTIIHLTAADCECNKFSEDHVNQIDKIANNFDFNVKKIELVNSDIVPSVPAIMVVDDTGSLLYLGPYATGLACSSNNSFVETVLNNFDAGYKSDLIVSQAQGCYCNLPLS